MIIRKSLHHFLLCILVVRLMTSCSDTAEMDGTPVFVDPLKNLPDAGAIAFENPMIGQRNRFVFFEAIYSTTSGEVAFSYYPDTLVIAITQKNSESWVVTEFLTKGSFSRRQANDAPWGQMGDDVFKTVLEVGNDSIQFLRPPETPVTFTLAKTEKFPAQLVSDDFPENTDGLPPFSEYNTTRWVEYVKNYQRLGATFDRLNIYFDYRDMALDGFGFTYLYSPADGLVRIAWINAWSMDTANGWDLIPQ